MEILIILLLFLIVTAALVTLVGHGIWLAVAWMFRQATHPKIPPASLPQSRLRDCPNCNIVLAVGEIVCGSCGCSVVAAELLQELTVTETQMERLYEAGRVSQELYLTVKTQLDAEKFALSNGIGPAETAVWPTNASEQQSPRSVTSISDIAEEYPYSFPTTSVPSAFNAEGSADEEIVKIPSFLQKPEKELEPSGVALQADKVAREYEQPVEPQRLRQRSMAEMFNAFMEESNIRWGEIVGGLLIIGCSTALVVSLWSEISQVPVLKFLIFTTVTAALFGIGLYTEHRWKLPTTSRGILTIATLLVPLNFLAIAAVSAGADSPGPLVILSELLAPAVFLCFVYFSGKVFTPAWPHLLAAGVLGSSVGQLLIRHFDSFDVPWILVALGAFPVVWYVGCAVWMLKNLLTEYDLHQREHAPIFITLGALTFAALLPFSLLLHKSGPVAMTMMYLAPLVTLGGLPMLTIGTFLWQRIARPEQATTRTAGTRLALRGMAIALAGLVLAWPNPASIVPAALFNFVVFTVLGLLLEFPVAHLLAAFCFGLAYLVLFHVAAGNVAWENLRVRSLLRESLSSSSGQVLAGLFAIFCVAAEWLNRKARGRVAENYLRAACAVAVASLSIVTLNGWLLTSRPESFVVWPVYGLYSVGAFWIATLNRRITFAWIGSLLLLATLAEVFTRFAIPFPWQTAMLAHASVCGIAAIVNRHYVVNSRQILSRPLNQSALVSSFLAILCLLLSGSWETTAQQAESMFWLAGVWLVLLWLNRHRQLFTIFQMAFTFALVLSIKATLQQFDWYAYLPHAFLHPWGLQIQGAGLIMLSLAWAAIRLAAKRLAPFARTVEESATGSPADVDHRNWTTSLSGLLDQQWSFDRLVAWFVLGGFLLLTIYGALSGIRQELTTERAVLNLVGFPHEQAFGPGSWILLGLVIIAMLLNFWERRRSIYFQGAIVALLALCPLLAGGWESEFATASAWRWVAALMLCALSLPLWFQERVFVMLKSFGWPEMEISQQQLSGRTRDLLLGATSTPILIFTLYPVLSAIFNRPTNGPTDGIFRLMGSSISYGVPLVIVALVLIGYAVRERLPQHAFAAGLFFNFTVTVIEVLSVFNTSAAMDRVVLVEIIQLNAITAAAFSFLWLSTRKHWQGKLPAPQRNVAENLLNAQVFIAIGLNALILLPVALKLVVAPELAGVATVAAGGAQGWLALLLTAIAAVWFAHSHRKPLTVAGVVAALIAVTCLAAFTAARWDNGHWTAFHTLMLGTALTAWLTWSARFIYLTRGGETTSASFGSTLRFSLSRRWLRDSSIFATLAGSLAVLLALRATLDDPLGAGCAINILVAMSVLAASLNWSTMKRGYLFAAGLLLSTASFVWSITTVSPQYQGAAMLQIHVVTLCLSSVLWLMLELRARSRVSATAVTRVSFHDLAAIWSLLIMGGIVGLRFVLSLFNALPGNSFMILDWLSLCSLFALLSACLWDIHAKYAVAGLYISGLFLSANALIELNLDPHQLAWLGTIVLAIYALGTSLLWRSRERLLNWTDTLSIPRRLPATGDLTWLTVFNISVVGVVAIASFWIDLKFVDGSLRTTAALSLTGQAVTFGLLAEAPWRKRWQHASITILVLGLVLTGWASLVPGINATWLNRAVIVTVEMFFLTGLYGLRLSRLVAREPDWGEAVKVCIPWIVGNGLVALLFSLGTEVFYQTRFGEVRIEPLSLLTIGLVLTAGIVISVLFALSQEHDPLGLSERGRMKYVYAAEVMLALLFMHIRLTMPWLFTGFFERYWPFVVMAIAYFGVATSESLRRRRLLVLAQPIERTGAFLPLLPVVGFWLAQSKVDYSALLFVVGGLYGLLSILRRSFRFGVIAAIAGNSGFWYLLHRIPDYHFLQHPQLWLIPAALSVLIAAYLNEDDFTEDQMAGIRYFSLVTIYASSTADIFINGVADSPWLPLVLAAFSLAGVFAGIIFRIRGLLLLGSVFLLLAIVTMIWYASANLGWTWLWYVAGIVTGATIIFMFAVFEKKRGEVLRVVEGLRDWNP